ncbi:hypothetical protein [Nostoc sp.]
MLSIFLITQHSALRTECCQSPSAHCQPPLAKELVAKPDGYASDAAIA